MAEESLLQHVGIPASQIHPMPTELGSDEAAQRYNQILSEVGEFDCVLLGMGEDAHTASLFPGQVWDGARNAPAIPVRNAPKPPADRVSLTASRLSNARQVLFFVTGAGKRDAVTAWRGGKDVPVAAIRPAAGVDVYMDAAACP
jgi:6-phosphogluconolactonase